MPHIPASAFSTAESTQITTVHTPLGYSQPQYMPQLTVPLLKFHYMPTFASAQRALLYMP